MAKINVSGNLAADPERVTTSEDLLVRFTVADSHQYVDRSTGEWVKTPPVWWRCEAWDTLAEHIASSCAKGTRVMVEGIYLNREYTDTNGEKKIRGALKVSDAGVSLRYTAMDEH